MKSLVRWAFRVLILLIVLVVAGILLLDTILKSALESRLRSETGMEVKIGRFRFGLVSPVIAIEDFKLYNPAEFGSSPLLDMPELHVEYDRRLVFSHQLHYTLIRLNLAELNLVQNKEGKSNLRVLDENGRKNRHRADRDAKAEKDKEKSKYVFAGIDTLDLTLGRATLLKMNNPGEVRELKLNIRNRVVTGIKTEQELDDVLLLALLEAGAKPVVDFVADAAKTEKEGQGKVTGQEGRPN